MDRAEKTGLGIATAGHVALFAALSLGLAVTRLPPPPAQPIEVSFVKDVGATNAAPQPAPAPPAQSTAPELAAPDEAAPEPAPPLPVPPEPAPPPPKAVETPRPKPTPKPAVKPAPAKPVAKPAPAQPAAKPAPARPVPQHAATGTAKATHGSHLSADFLKGLGSDPTPSRAQQAPASVMSAEALAGITAAIKRQIQPCANRQVDPGPGANQIKVTLNLRLNRDGSLTRTPTVVRTAGVTAGNSRYEDRVRDLAVAAYVGCAPLRDLPENLYQTPKGGWGNINMTYNLP